MPPFNPKQQQRGIGPSQPPNEQALGNMAKNVVSQVGMGPIQGMLGALGKGRMGGIGNGLNAPPPMQPPQGQMQSPQQMPQQMPQGMGQMVGGMMGSAGMSGIGPQQQMLQKQMMQRRMQMQQPQMQQMNSQQNPGR